MSAGVKLHGESVSGLTKVHSINNPTLNNGPHENTKCQHIIWTYGGK
jgi:hypothetical protein